MYIKNNAKFYGEAASPLGAVTCKEVI